KREVGALGPLDPASEGLLPVRIASTSTLQRRVCPAPASRAAARWQAGDHAVIFVASEFVASRPPAPPTRYLLDDQHQRQADRDHEDDRLLDHRSTPRWGGCHLAPVYPSAAR